MRKLLLARAILLVALSSPAMATEVAPVFETLPPSQVAPHDWNGAYGSGGDPWTRVPYDTLISGAPVGSLTSTNLLNSRQFGYNYQSGSFVFGIEADVSQHHGIDSILLAPAGLDSFNLRGEQGWIGTLRPRMGVAADNWLLYGTGGLTYSTSGQSDADALAGAGRAPGDTGARAGWTGGAGIEYAGGKRWSLGLEYLYANVGKSSLNQTAVGLFPSTPSTHDQSHLLRGRFNYQFDWGLPQK
jgi:outer membrane immunogenic protein